MSGGSPGTPRERSPVRQVSGSEPTHADVIVAVVQELLEAGGYDAVQLREVAARAHVSLATIYRLFSSRDELIVTALERWMGANSYAELALPTEGESVYDGLMRGLRYVFEPWERNPRMLEAYHRARTGPGGRRLDRQGMQAIEPNANALLANADPEYVEDITLILKNLAYAVIGRFAAGNIDITAILPTLERAVYRLTVDNATPAIEARARRTRPHPT
jgi:TetR/AcrR family transcriptional regulator, cholesterol catabolism regulator